MKSRAARVDFAKMSDEEIAVAIERIESMRGAVAARLEAAVAKQVDTKWQRLRTQIDAGDKVAAQATWVEIRALIFGR